MQDADRDVLHGLLSQPFSSAVKPQPYDNYRVLQLLRQEILSERTGYELRNKVGSHIANKRIRKSE
jgi:hypothetical protein